MDNREKLIELFVQEHERCDNTLCNECEYSHDNDCGVNALVDHLIANGVTIQKWISVKDERKPQHGDIALCYMTFGEYRLLQWDDRSKLWVGDYMDFGFEDVAYWQMPQPPKGE